MVEPPFRLGARNSITAVVADVEVAAPIAGALGVVESVTAKAKVLASESPFASVAVTV